MLSYPFIYGTAVLFMASSSVVSGKMYRIVLHYHLRIFYAKIHVFGIKKKKKMDIDFI